MAEDLTDQLGTILGVWAHPDDEAYLSAGLMATAVDAGKRVVCVTATRGEAGFPDDDPRGIEERMAIREAELAACLETLGVTEHRWLGYRDGVCDQVPDDEPAATLATIITEIRPDTVLTFGPDGMTGHVDHMAVSRWCTAAVSRLEHDDVRLLYATKTTAWNDRFMRLIDPGQVMMQEGLEPPAARPDELAVWYELDDALLDRKLQALHCQPSQVLELAGHLGDEAFRDLNREEFFRPATEVNWS